MWFQNPIIELCRRFMRRVYALSHTTTNHPPTSDVHCLLVASPEILPLGLEFLEVRADHRRDILGGGGGDIGDRVGDGQDVEM